MASSSARLRPQIVIVAAVAENGVIGADNDMPWRLPSDLRHFKTITLGKPVVMGRKTFESLGRPLPGRPNIVISRQPAYAPEGVEVAGSLADALARAVDLAADLGVDEIVVMGGGQIYAEAMALADRLEITEVRARPEGDTRFPAIDRDVWQETARVEGVRGEKDSSCFCHVTWRRKDIPAPAQ